MRVHGGNLAPHARSGRQFSQNTFSGRPPALASRHAENVTVWPRHVSARNARQPDRHGSVGVRALEALPVGRTLLAREDEVKKPVRVPDFECWGCRRTVRVGCRRTVRVPWGMWAKPGAPMQGGILLLEGLNVGRDK